MKVAIILSGIPWNTSLQRHHKVATWLKEMKYDVYFIEKITSSKFSFTKLLKRTLEIINKKNKTKIDNPANGINVMSYKFINPEFKIYNNRISRKIIKKIPFKVDLIINYLPIETTKFLIDNIKHKYLIYDCVRDFKNWGGYGKKVETIEKDLINEANIVFTDSYYITDKMKTNYPNKKIIQLLPTFEKYQKQFIFEAIKEIKRITYFGQLGEHIDTEILKLLSKSGYEINIIGDISIKLDFKYNYFGFFSDKKKMIDLIMEKSDAIIIPYKGNMDGVIPVKIFESLATLRPVFINSFYDSEKLKKYLYVYNNYDELKILLENFNYIDFLKKVDKINIILNSDQTCMQSQIFKKEINEL